MAAEPQEGGRLSGRRRALGFAAGLLILVFLGLGVAKGWDRVSRYDWRFEPRAAAGGFAALLGLYVMGAYGYVLILEQLAGRRVPRRRFVAVWARSILGRYVPGNVLMVASRLVLGREAGISRKVSLAASVYEQALSLGAMALGGVILVVAYGSSSVGAAAWLVALVPLGLVALHPRFFGPLTTWLLVRLKREPLEVLLTGRQLAALLAWYRVMAVLLALGVALIVRSAVPGRGAARLRRAVVPRVVRHLDARVRLPLGARRARGSSSRSRCRATCPAGSRSPPRPASGSCSRWPSCCSWPPRCSWTGAAGALRRARWPRARSSPGSGR